MYFRRISAIHCNFLTSIQTSNVHSDGMVDFDNANIYFCLLHLLTLTPREDRRVRLGSLLTTTAWLQLSTTH